MFRFHFMVTRLTIGLLIVATGLVTGSVLAASQSPSGNLSTSAGLDQKQREVANRYYDAVNGVLAGRTDLLGEAVALQFVDHETQSETGHLNSFQADLERRARLYPGLVVKVVELMTDGDVVAVTTNAMVPDEPAFATISLAGFPIWPKVEYLRIGGNMVVERWANTPPMPIFDPVAQGRLTLLQPGEQVLSIVRVEIGAGAMLDSDKLAGPGLLYLPQGQLEVSIESTGMFHSIDAESVPTESAASPSISSLAAGSQLSISADSRVVVRNPGSEQAVLLAVMLAPFASWPAAGAPSDSDTIEGNVTITTLAGDLASLSGPGSYNVEIANLTMPPDASIPFHTTTGPEMLVITSGQVTVPALLGNGWLRSGIGFANLEDGDIASVDNGVSIETGATWSASNDSTEPATAILIVITNETPGNGN